MRRPSPALAVSILALVAALGGVALASPIRSDGTVHLCYSQDVIDGVGGTIPNILMPTNEDVVCPNDYPNRLVLNQKGPQGTAGPPGQVGPSGVRPLDTTTIQNVLDELNRVQRERARQRTLLRRHKAELNRLTKPRGQAKGDRVAKAQRTLANRMTALLNMMDRLRDTQQEIVTAIGR